MAPSSHVREFRKTESLISQRSFFRNFSVANFGGVSFCGNPQKAQMTEVGAPWLFAWFGCFQPIFDVLRSKSAKHLPTRIF